MTTIAQQTLASIALSNHGYIPVLEKYSLDFCCRGKKTLEQACTEKNIPLTHVIEELNHAVADSRPLLPFNEMTVDQLISYVQIHHHFYIRNSFATIHGHIQKVAAKHGERYPHMRTVLELFTAVIEELLPHMEKEEKILFPRIQEIASGENKAAIVAMGPGYLSTPIQMMEAEHDTSGQLMFRIRELTNDFTPPADACTTHRICLEELRSFETDLHQHVHVENNVLFPLALQKVMALHN